VLEIVWSDTVAAVGTPLLITELASLYRVVEA
jgi:hypothetical protein